MRVITITDDNIKYVYGRLRKFFNHENFMSWHQFDCGMKKHIKHCIKLSNGSLIDVRRKYSGIETSLGGKIIGIILSQDEAFSIKVGDKVAFRGNHIIIRTPFTAIRGYHYLYQVFQISNSRIKNYKL